MYIQFFLIIEATSISLPGFQTRSKPLKLRLRALLEQIDPKIIPALKSGRRDFEGGIPASQYIDLERLASEADAKGFITVDPDVKMGIGMGAQGTTYGVKFHVDPSIASD